MNRCPCCWVSPFPVDSIIRCLHQNGYERVRGQFSDSWTIDSCTLHSEPNAVLLTPEQAATQCGAIELYPFHVRSR